MKVKVKCSMNQRSTKKTQPLFLLLKHATNDLRWAFISPDRSFVEFCLKSWLESLDDKIMIILQWFTICSVVWIWLSLHWTKGDKSSLLNFSFHYESFIIRVHCFKWLTTLVKMESLSSYSPIECHLVPQNQGSSELSLCPPFATFWKTFSN